MLNFENASVQLANLKGVEKQVKDIDKFIAYFAGKESALDEVKVNKVDFEKIKKKALTLATKQNEDKKVNSVDVYHRGFKLVAG